MTLGILLIAFIVFFGAYTCGETILAYDYSAQQDNFAGSLKYEMAAILSASAMVG